MFHGRLPRRVEVDWPRRHDDRVPILDGRPTFAFGEPAYAEVDGRRLEGLIGWDPSLGWVLNLSEAALASIAADVDDPE